MGRRKTVTRKPAYGDAVYWLAANDDTLEHEPDTIKSLTTVLLAADLFGVEPYSLAVDIVRSRHGAGRWALPAEARCNCQERVA